MATDLLNQLKLILGEAYPSPTSCNTITIPMNLQAPSKEATALHGFLCENKVSSPNAERNEVKAFILSTPRNLGDRILLGRIRLDRKDSRLDEDLFEVTATTIDHMSVRDAEKRYPDYKGYHRGDKSFLEDEDKKSD